MALGFDFPKVQCAYCRRRVYFDRIVGSVEHEQVHSPYCEQCLRADPSLARRPQYWKPEPGHVRRVLGAPPPAGAGG
jgi:NAD-dependent SIR2 family protein deacetylase